MIELPSWEVISSGGIGGILAAIIVAGMRGLYVWKWDHEAIVQSERERRERAEREAAAWRDAYLRLGRAADEIGMVDALSRALGEKPS